MWDKYSDIVLGFLKGLLVQVVKMTSQFQKNPPWQGKVLVIYRENCFYIHGLWCTTC